MPQSKVFDLKSPVLKCVLVIVFFIYPVYISFLLFKVMLHNDLLTLLGGIFFPNTTEHILEAAGSSHTVPHAPGLISLMASFVSFIIGCLACKSLGKTMMDNANLHSALSVPPGSKKALPKVPGKSERLEKLFRDVAKAKGKFHHGMLLAGIAFAALVFGGLLVLLYPLKEIAVFVCPDLLAEHFMNIMAYWFLALAGFMITLIVLCVYIIYIFTGEGKPVEASAPGLGETPSMEKSKAPLKVAAGVLVLVVLALLGWWIGNGTGEKEEDEEEIVVTLPEAAAAGDTAKVKELLAAGADINAKDSAGKTPVVLAAENNRSETAWQLIEAGADINFEQPLVWAARNGYTELARYMLDTKGVDANAKNTAWKSALTLAVEAGHYETASLLMTRGADTGGDTPLLWAAKNGHSEFARFLVEAKNADINAKGLDGKTAVILAVEKRNTDLADYLFAHGADIDGGSPVLWAAKNGHLDFAEHLIGNGADTEGRPRWIGLLKGDLCSWRIVSLPKARRPEASPRCIGRPKRGTRRLRTI